MDRVLCWQRHHRLPYCATLPRERADSHPPPFTMSARLRERAALWWTHAFAVGWE